MSFSVLKPLAGDEPGLQENLRGFFQLDDPKYEPVFAARDVDDPALARAESLASLYPEVRSKALVAGEPPCPNAKVHSLGAMTSAAAGDVLVISDSDIRADPALLRELAAEFTDPAVGVVTCPYRAVPGRSPWSLLEALGMNSEFWSGVLAAQFLAPMDFAVGPTMAVRRTCLEAIGGWRAVEEHLAEDFQLGRLARRAGFDVRLGTQVVEHHIGSQGLGANLAHRLRWLRSTRRSRPAGYWGQLFANPLPWALLAPGAVWSWILAAACGALRALVLLAVGGLVLRDRLVVLRCWLVPVQDVLSLVLWAAGFFGDRIVWRGGTFQLMRDGRLQRLER